MKKHFYLTSLVAILATTGGAIADEVTIDSIKASLNGSAVTEPAPEQSAYTYIWADGSTVDLTSDKTDYAGYVAQSAAENNEYVELADGKSVKLGETMEASSYEYSSKDANGVATMISGDTDVADLTRTYESDYGNIVVSTNASPVVNIDNYKEVGDNDVVYSLHDNGDGTFAIFNNGIDVTEAFGNKLDKLQSAYEADIAGVAALKEKLDGYKEYNTTNHDAIADIITADNDTIATIDGYKATFETATSDFNDATVAYNTAVDSYNNSLGKVVDDKIAAGSVNSVVESAKLVAVTEPAPEQSAYTYTWADGSTVDLTSDKTDYAGYVAQSAAENNEYVELADGKSVKLGETMEASSYEYSSKDANGVATMISGDTDVADLTRTYESDYGNIVVSTASEPVVDIDNYVNGDYSLGIQDGKFVLYQKGTLELDSPNMLAELQGAYEADVAGVAALKEELDGYKEYNTTNHDAIAGIMEADNATITTIDGYKTTWETASDDYAADTLAYNTAVDNYNNSLSKVFDDRMSMGDVAGNNFAANDNVVAAVSKIDTNMGTIHGLISEESSANRQTTNGKTYNGNLAIGTTVEDHLLALDTAIGDRDTLTGDNLVAGGSVVDNLQSLNNGIANETQRATAEEASIRAEFAAADAQLQQQINANIANANFETLANANSYTDKKVNTLEKNLSGGVAAATALSAVAVSNVGKGELSVGGGYGYYNSQSAVAVGAAMGLSDRWSVNAGAGFASGDKTQVSFRTGTNYKFKLF